MSQMGPTERAWTTGLVALANSEFYVVGSEYTFKFDVTVWAGSALSWASA